MNATDEFLARFEEQRAARKQADRSFSLLGETLTVKPSISYSVSRDLENARLLMAEGLDNLVTAQKVYYGDGNGHPGDESEENLRALIANTHAQRDCNDRLLQVAEETILDCLSTESHEAWGRMRAKDADEPLTSDEMLAIADYLIGKVAGLPTSAPVDSPDGREQTSKPSKGSSSSRVKSRASSD